MQLARYFISNAICRHRDTLHAETANSNESTSARKIARFSSNISRKYEGRNNKNEEGGEIAGGGGARAKRSRGRKNCNERGNKANRGNNNRGNADLLV